MLNQCRCCGGNTSNPLGFCTPECNEEYMDFSIRLDDDETVMVACPDCGDEEACSCYLEPGTFGDADIPW